MMSKLLIAALLLQVPLAAQEPRAVFDKAVTELGAEAFGLDEIYDVAVDVYSTCALGAPVNEQTLPRLNA